jgi:hypothetical protein
MQAFPGDTFGSGETWEGGRGGDPRAAAMGSMVRRDVTPHEGERVRGGGGEVTGGEVEEGSG